MLSITDVSIVLPSYNPDKALLNVVEGLSKAGFTDIIIINDGSRAECLKFFKTAEQQYGCTVLTHTANQGKGAALKTGFNFFLKNKTGHAGVVTVDGDNQHKASDVLACVKAMLDTDKIILGARCFDQKNIPRKSRMGNLITKVVVRTLLALPITDTQTGLRAIPSKYLNEFLNTSGDRYEYETNMLIKIKQKHFSIMEIPITTVYIEDNKSSHFKPFLDSLRIYSQFIKYIAGSIISFLIDIVMFYFLIRFFNFGFYTVWICTALARIVSSIYNFFHNRKFVFQKNDLFKQLFRYYCLCLPLMALSALLVFLATNFTPSAWPPAAVTYLKIAVDCFLFIMSYFIQKHWVFRKEEFK